MVKGFCHVGFSLSPELVRPANLGGILTVLARQKSLTGDIDIHQTNVFVFSVVHIANKFYFEVMQCLETKLLDFQD